MKKRKLTHEQSIILALWEQFAYQSGYDNKPGYIRKWTGGLATLEWAEEYLKFNGIINSWGNKKKEIEW